MPFYQFNPFTGRLKESTRFQPLYPLSPSPLQNTEPPAMIYDTPKTKPVKVGASLATAGYSTLTPRFAKLLKRYQVDMEKPAYLLGGPRDKMLFGLTCVMLAVCFAQSSKFVFDSMKK